MRVMDTERLSVLPPRRSTGREEGGRPDKQARKEKEKPRKCGDRPARASGGVYGRAPVGTLADEMTTVTT